MCFRSGRRQEYVTEFVGVSTMVCVCGGGVSALVCVYVCVCGGGGVSIGVCVCK